MDTLAAVAYAMLGALALFVLYVVFCAVTRIRFAKGSFYIIRLRRYGDGPLYAKVVRKIASNSRAYSFFLNLLPNTRQSKSLHINNEVVELTARSPISRFPVCRRAFPLVRGANAEKFNQIHFSRHQLHALINGIEIELAPSVSELVGDVLLKDGRGIIERGTAFLLENRYALIFVSKETEKQHLN